MRFKAFQISEYKNTLTVLKRLTERVRRLTDEMKLEFEIRNRGEENFLKTVPLWTAVKRTSSETPVKAVLRRSDFRSVNIL